MRVRQREIKQDDTFTGIYISLQKNFPIEFGDNFGGGSYAIFNFIRIYQLFLNLPSQIHVLCHDLVQPV
jgi:hypothetical protein